MVNYSYYCYTYDDDTLQDAYHPSNRCPIFDVDEMHGSIYEYTLAYRVNAIKHRDSYKFIS